MVLTMEVVTLSETMGVPAIVTQLPTVTHKADDNATLRGQQHGATEVVMIILRRTLAICLLSLRAAVTGAKGREDG